MILPEITFDLYIFGLGTSFRIFFDVWAKVGVGDETEK